MSIKLILYVNVLFTINRSKNKNNIYTNLSYRCKWEGVSVMVLLMPLSTITLTLLNSLLFYMLQDKWSNYLSAELKGVT